MSQQTNPPIKTTQTCFRIIETLRHLQGAGVTELADQLDIPNSTVHDHLKTLEREDCVVKRDDQYHIGMRFLELGGHARNKKRVFQIAQPEMRRLADETGEHVNVMIEEHGWGIFLHRIEGKEAVELDTHAGMRVYLHTTALGKAMLSHMSEERVEKIIETQGLPEMTDNTLSTREELFEELEAIRDRGYATDDEERIAGMRCVAVPICPGDRVLGAVSVSGPKSKMQGERFQSELPRKVQRTANIIEVNTQHH